jgi:DNA repair protein RecO (recombination protein O)
MPLHTGDALVLRTYRLGESDRLVVMLTRERGKKRGVARGGARSRKRFGGALEPFTHVRVAYHEREQRDLVRLDYADVLGSTLSIGGEACAYASYFAELLDEWAPENDPQERLYRLGVAVLDALTAGGDAARLARYFEYWLLRLQGVYPSTVACPQCGAPLRAGAVLEPRSHWYLCRQCASHAQGVAMPAGAVRFLADAAQVAPAALGDVDVSSESLGQLAAAHRLLLVWHLDREPRAARVLREINP